MALNIICGKRSQLEPFLSTEQRASSVMMRIVSLIVCVT